LCVENAELLIKGVKVTSYDPAIKGPDTNQNDERSFLRALKSARMDIIDSDISFLGNGLDTSNAPIQREGGTYGISWRIPDDMLGVEIVTGWVQGTDFHNNHFGSYTYGASGMVWDGNRFYNNDVYGLDPHDDSNNALIQNNVFDHNGKHGFIVSKRCNYNIIRNNVSHDNALHGYMLHQDSAYNVFDNNIAYNNTDNFAIYASDFNMVKNNKSYNPRGSHVRVNAQSNNTFITGNTFAGGGNGVYAYGNTVNTYVADNTFQSTKNIVLTNGAKNVFIGNNTLDRLGYKVKNGDRIIFGPNTIASNSLSLPDGVNLKILLASKITQPTNETNE
jgi:parallel beta-helix repeat protein